MKKDSFNFNFKESISVYFFKSKKTELSLLYEALVTKIVFFLLLILFLKFLKLMEEFHLKEKFYLIKLFYSIYYCIYLVDFLRLL